MTTEYRARFHILRLDTTPTFIHDPYVLLAHVFGVQRLKVLANLVSAQVDESFFHWGMNPPFPCRLLRLLDIGDVTLGAPPIS